MGILFSTALPMHLYNNDIVFGPINGSVSVELPVYSYPEIENVTIYREDVELAPGLKYNISFDSSEVHTRFYDVEVTLNGSVIRFTIDELQTEDFGTYTITVTNELGINNITVNVYADSK